MVLPQETLVDHALGRVMDAPVSNHVPVHAEPNDIQVIVDDDSATSCSHWAASAPMSGSVGVVAANFAGRARRLR